MSGGKGPVKYYSAVAQEALKSGSPVGKVRTDFSNRFPNSVSKYVFFFLFLKYLGGHKSTTIHEHKYLGI